MKSDYDKLLNDLKKVSVEIQIENNNIRKTSKKLSRGTKSTINVSVVSVFFYSILNNILRIKLFAIQVGTFTFVTVPAVIFTVFVSISTVFYINKRKPEIKPIVSKPKIVKIEPPKEINIINTPIVKKKYINPYYKLNKKIFKIVTKMNTTITGKLVSSTNKQLLILQKSGKYITLKNTDIFLKTEVK